MSRKEDMRVLVHICCGACASHVFSELEKEGYTPVGLFYNPEIHGLAEYKQRLKDVTSYCNEKNIELIVPEYNIEDFFSRLLPFQDKQSIKYINDKARYRRRRCQVCISLLLENLFNTAKDLNITKVTTTMLCSPFRDHSEIWNRGVDIEAAKRIQFIYKDFRKGYWNGRNYARTHDFAVPKYCGCSESLEEGLLE